MSSGYFCIDPNGLAFKFVQMLFKNSVPATEKKVVRIAIIIWLMLVREIIDLIAVNRTKHISKLCVHNSLLLIVKVRGCIS